MQLVLHDDCTGPNFDYCTAIANCKRLRANSSSTAAAVGDLVNLNKYRKQRQRAEADRQASENRVQFGRSKIERTRTNAEHQRHVESLDGKRLDERHEDEAE